MKYIEENRLEGAELKELHRTLIKASGIVTSNLFFHQGRHDAAAGGRPPGHQP